MLTLAFFVGSLFGATLGILVSGLLRAASDADRMLMCLDCEWRKVTP